MSWLDGWNYRRGIIIDNTGNSNALTDYQVKVVLDSSNFDFSKANSDGSDIRFTDNDGTTLLNYWIESWDSLNQTATIWIKVPLIPASSSYTIYMYYGNLSATSESNGENTFIFFDNFEGTSLDTNKWEITYSDAGSYSLLDSNLYINLKTNTGEIKSLTIRNKNLFSYSEISSYSFTAKIKANGENNSANRRILSGIGIGKENSDGNDWGNKFIVGWDGYNDRYALHGWIGHMESLSLSASNDIYYTYYLHINSSNNARGCIGNSCDDATWDIGQTTNYRLVLGGQGNAYVEYWIDWIHICKYTSPEPTTSVGSEEINPVSGFILSPF